MAWFSYLLLALQNYAALGISPAVLYESMLRAFFSHRLFNPALLAAEFTPVDFLALPPGT
jgi:hypothetical protein